MYNHTPTGHERPDATRLLTADPAIRLLSLLERYGVTSRFFTEPDYRPILVVERNLTRGRVTVQSIEAGGWRTIAVESHASADPKERDDRLRFRWEGKRILSGRTVTLCFTDPQGRPVALYGQTPALMAEIDWTHIRTEQGERATDAGDEPLVARAGDRIASMMAELETENGRGFWQRVFDQ